MSGIVENIASIRGEIEKLAGGRRVWLVAASKTRSPEEIREAIAAGADAAGENRVQEYMEKYEQGAFSGIDSHIIGHLQTNKVKYIVGKVSLIESVDSEKLAAEIDRQAKKLGVVQDILCEINIGGEEAKSGAAPEALPELLEAVSQLSSVRVRGLMAVAPKDDGFGLASRCFARMYKLFVDNRTVKSDNIAMEYLSMGMSGDYKAALSEGSNMIRIGSSIFGPRFYPERNV